MVTETFGRFQTTALLGRGGMGEVWRATSPGGLDVAVKCVNSPDAEVTHALLGEIASLARLDHPSVLRILDQGMGKSGPWLAMELGRSSLDAVPLPDRFASWRAEIAGILRGLAHAHARGVLHRDVKPGNVLMLSDGRLCLCDFGLARVAERDGTRTSEIARGSPGYLPPEQIEGAVRDQGPWTDLYALGCLAWARATGMPPYQGSVPAVLRAHLSGPLPTFEGRFPMPQEAEGWLFSLLEREPGLRPGRAADALRALLMMPDPGGEGAAGSPVGAAMTVWVSQILAPQRGVYEGSRGARQVLFPPVPVPNQRPSDPKRARRMGGVSLFGLRVAPLAGREQERDLLWDQLRRVAARGRASTVILHGNAGVGKSRIGRWLVEAVEEEGLGTGLVALHGIPEHGAHGPAAALRRWCGADGLVGGPALSRLSDALISAGATPPLAQRIAMSLAPEATFDARVAAILEALELLAAERPVVLLLDDAIHCAEALAVFQRVDEVRAPVLVVATLAPGADPVLEGRFASSAGLRIPVGSLDGATLAALVADLGVDDESVVQTLSARAGGNPLFAVELVAERLRDPDAPVPMTLDVLWGNRLRRLLDERGLLAVERAAVLGAVVDVSEWRALCGPIDEVLRALILSDLVRIDGERFGFFAQSFREAVLAGAAAGGRLVGHHRDVAALLTRLSAAESRVGRHLFEADALAEAFGPLMAGATAERRRGDLAASENLMSTALLCLDGLGAPPSDSRRLGTEALRAWMLQLLGDVQGAVAAAAAVENRAIAAGEWMAAGDARWVLAESARLGGDAASGLAGFLAAAALMAKGDAAIGRSDSLRGAGWCAMLVGDFDQANRLLGESLDLADTARDPNARASTLMAMGWMHSMRGDHVLALALLRDSAVGFERASYPLGQIAASRFLGEALCRAGEVDVGRAMLTEALDRYVRCSYGHVGDARTAVASWCLTEGDTAGAIRHADATIAHANYPCHLRTAQLILAAAHALDGRSNEAAAAWAALPAGAPTWEDREVARRLASRCQATGRSAWALRLRSYANSG